MPPFDESALDHPVAQRMVDNFLRHGVIANEIFRMQGATPEELLYFDVFSLRTWARDHGELVNLWFNWDLAYHLVSSGAVDPDHLFDVTLMSEYTPVIVGRDVLAQGDVQILDGAHRYVAASLVAQGQGLEGERFTILAYALAPDEWSEFVIPPSLVDALDIGRHCD